MVAEVALDQSSACSLGSESVRGSSAKLAATRAGLYFGKTSYNDLLFARNEFLRLVGVPNESLILIIIYYVFKYSVGIKTTSLESLRSQKIILNAIFPQNLL